MNRLLIPTVALAASLTVCARDHRLSVSGTWIAHDTSETTDCPECRFWAGLDLFENRQGIVTGAMAQVGTGEFDIHSDALYVLGTRVSDSIMFVVQPCDSAAPAQRFRGRVSPSGDTLQGILRSQIVWRSRTDSFQAPLVFSRGAIDDTVMVRAFEWLAKACRAAA